MAELDFQDRMIDAIEAHCQLFQPITEPFIKNGEGIGFALLPSGNERRDYAGNITRTYPFQISAQSTDQIKALSALQSISQYLDRVDLNDIKSQNGTFEAEKISVQSIPNFVGVDKTGVILYECSYQADLFLKG